MNTRNGSKNHSFAVSGLTCYLLQNHVYTWSDVFMYVLIYQNFVCMCIYVYKKGVHVFSMLFKFGVLLSVSASLDISFGNVPL